jgi:hypothetical protein
MGFAHPARSEKADLSLHILFGGGLHTGPGGSVFCIGGCLSRGLPRNNFVDLK